jgi:hypothetical protein
MNRSYLCLTLLGLTLSGAVLAQSTGGFSPSSSGAAAAGGSPVGMVVPYTVRWGSSAPTLPGHTLRSDSGSSGSWAGAEPKVPVARAPSRDESARTNGVTPSNREELASAAAPKPAQP